MYRKQCFENIADKNNVCIDIASKLNIFAKNTNQWSLKRTWRQMVCGGRKVGMMFSSVS